MPELNGPYRVRLDHYHVSLVEHTVDVQLTLEGIFLEYGMKSVPDLLPAVIVLSSSRMSAPSSANNLATPSSSELLSVAK